MSRRRRATAGSTGFLLDRTDWAGAPSSPRWRAHGQVRATGAQIEARMRTWAARAMAAEEAVVYSFLDPSQPLGQPPPNGGELPVAAAPASLAEAALPAEASVAAAAPPAAAAAMATEAEQVATEEEVVVVHVAGSSGPAAAADAAVAAGAHADVDAQEGGSGAVASAEEEVAASAEEEVAAAAREEMADEVVEPAADEVVAAAQSS